MSTAKQQKQQKKSEHECEIWNRSNPVGTAVSITLDSGEVRKTTTRTEAYVSNAGYAVIFLEGISGYYLLDRVKVRVEPIIAGPAS
jgi:hypothetical protein